MSKPSDLLKSAVDRALQAKKWSQSDLARQMKVAPGDLSDWLSGKVAIKFDRFCAVAEGLGLEPWELIMPEGALSTRPEPTPEEALLVLARTLHLTGERLQEVLDAVGGVEVVGKAVKKPVPPNDVQTQDSPEHEEQGPRPVHAVRPSREVKADEKDKAHVGGDRTIGPQSFERVHAPSSVDSGQNLSSDPLLARVARLSPEQRKDLENLLDAIEGVKKSRGSSQSK